MNKPAPMSDEQIIEASEAVWGSELDYKHLAEIQFARAIIAARDKQWTDLINTWTVECLEAPDAAPPQPQGEVK